LSETNLLLYLALGAFQGIVEWFPLSSSGQISLILQHYGLDPVEALSTALWIHSGSLMAILVRFRGEFRRMLSSVGEGRTARTDEGRIARFLVVGTAFTALTGIPAYVIFFEWFSENPGSGVFTLLVGVLLVITGIVLVLGSRLGFGERRAADLNWLDGALTGIAQGFAVLPGVSRSGFTVAALLGRKMEKADALRLSFLLDVPAITGAMALTYYVSIDNGAIFTLPMALAVLAAFTMSYFSMTALISFARRIDLSKFCILYGSLAAAAAAIQILI
jgi:undecaprenyl-diphosphatase